VGRGECASKVELLLSIVLPIASIKGVKSFSVALNCSDSVVVENNPHT
jgi:hypothetical protein